MEGNERASIKPLLAVLFSAVACALLLTAYMIYKYNPSGHYFAGNILLSPKAAKEMRYPYKEGKHKPLFFVFDKVEFSYWNAPSNSRKEISISFENYQSFYDLISADESVEPMASLFNNPTKSILNLYIHAENSLSPDKLFQKVEFVKDIDYYRVQLAEGSTKPEWVYFEHPQIEQLIKQLLL